jgi:hypothetical protein
MTWKPGASGNPKGRKAEKPFLDALRMEIAAAGENHFALRQIAKQVIAKATDGEPWAVQLMFERLDGKVPQPIEGEHTITHVAIDERRNRIKELQTKAITTDYKEVEE